MLHVTLKTLYSDVAHTRTHEYFMSNMTVGCCCRRLSVYNMHVSQHKVAQILTWFPFPFTKCVFCVKCQLSLLSCQTNGATTVQTGNNGTFTAVHSSTLKMPLVSVDNNSYSFYFNFYLTIFISFIVKLKGICCVYMYSINRLYVHYKFSYIFIYFFLWRISIVLQLMLYFNLVFFFFEVSIHFYF